MRTEILQSISGTYPNLISIPIPEDINDVLVGLPLSECFQITTTSVSSILELDSAEVKNAVARLATIASKSCSGRFNVDELFKERISLLSGAI